MTPHEQRLLEIETARERYDWAKAQIESGGATAALTKYMEASLQELRILIASDAELEQAEQSDETSK